MTDPTYNRIRAIAEAYRRRDRLAAEYRDLPDDAPYHWRRDLAVHLTQANQWLERLLSMEAPIDQVA